MQKHIASSAFLTPPIDSDFHVETLHLSTRDPKDILCFDSLGMWNFVLEQVSRPAVSLREMENGWRVSEELESYVSFIQNNYK